MTGSQHNNQPRRRMARRAEWKTTSVQHARRGTGVSYGALTLTPKDHYHIAHPTQKEQTLRIAVMGGNEEVGRNMTMLEYGRDIILIDMGIQFGEEHMRGIDGIVQDFSYLKGREKDVKAVIITHMHMDHIGAIPYLMPLLPGVPLFSAPITLALIAKKLEYTPEVKVDMRPVDEDTRLTLGSFSVSFIGVSHSVPSALAVIVDTPVGKVVHTGDFKVDFAPKEPDTIRYLEQLKSLGNQNVLALLADSTNAGQGGHQVMEHEVVNDLEAIVRSASGRLFFGMISTNVVRMAQIIQLAEKYGRSVVVGGKSLKTTLEIAEKLGYVNIKPGTLLDVEDLAHLQPNKVLAIFPGAQGESNAAFYKLANNDLKGLRVVPGDTVVFSSSIIPGNERTVQFITDKFYRLGAKVVNFRSLNVHSGGHAKAGDLGAVISLVKPKYLVPIEGHVAFLHHHAEAAMTAGFRREHIFIADNGQVIAFYPDGRGGLTKERISTRPIFVDGKTLGAVDEDTLRVRKQLGDEGMLLVQALRTQAGLQQLHFHFVGVVTPKYLQIMERDLERKMKEEYHKVQWLTTDRATHTLEQKLNTYLTERVGISPYVHVMLVNAPSALPAAQSRVTPARLPQRPHPTPIQRRQLVQHQPTVRRLPVVGREPPQRLPLPPRVSTPLPRRPPAHHIPPPPLRHGTRGA